MVSILALGVVLDTWVYIVAGVGAVGIAAAGVVMKKKENASKAAKAKARAGK